MWFEGGKLVLENVQQVVLLMVLFVTAYRDWKERVVDIRILGIAGALEIVFEIAVQPANWLERAEGAALGIILILLALVSGQMLGIGDGVIFVITGIFLGFWGNMELFLLSLWMAGILALFLLIIKKRGRKYQIPFVPFILGAYVIMLI
jgi:leader peptidase (prepilin peptidase)/N-methyltransferase